VLRVQVSPVRIDLKTPAGLLAGDEIDIQENRLVAPAGPEARVAATPQAVAVFWKNLPILMAQAVESDTILIHADFRPLGMNIFDDAAGLHVGGGLLGGNSFRGCSTAISLG
jgi:hypothetical protein